MSWREHRLTDHFALREFVCRGVSCCCHGAVLVDPLLVDVLEEFRSLVGGPLVVNSGYRCDSYNAAVGGHPGSFHRLGMAADVTSVRLRSDLDGWAHQVAAVILGRFGSETANVIFYPRRGFIHVDVGHRIAELVRKMD